MISQPESDCEYYEPTWSRDGTKILFERKYHGKTNIFVMTLSEAIIPTTTPTPTPTPTPIPIPMLTSTPTVTPTEFPTPEEKGVLGFEAVFAFAGLFAVAYLLRRRG